jgi:hypothetical protein
MLRPVNGGEAVYDTANRDGSFIVHRVPAGSYQLVVRPRGSSEELSVTDVDVVEGANRSGLEIAVNLPPAPEFPPLRGKVVRPDGTPAALARVQLNRADNFTGASPKYTGIDGAFVIPAMDDARAYECWVSDASRDFAAWVQIDASYDRSTPLSITLSPTVEMSGSVTLNGDPLAGGRFSFRSSCRVVARDMSCPREPTTGANIACADF